MNKEESELIEVSRKAYLECKERNSDDLFETESESEDTGTWSDVGNVLSDKAKQKVAKERQRIKSAAKRRIAKKLVDETILKRKIPKQVSSILTKFSDIGKKMESYVREHRVGADQWRRTGVLTFASNKEVGEPKVTYKKLQMYLEQEYKTKIAYGTVVQLCAVRNKRRISAKRYKGAAAITCRRARKGFDVKFNPDSHWSYSFYKGLDRIQLEDGKDKLIVKKDDQAGFRLDST